MMSRNDPGAPMVVSVGEALIDFVATETGVQVGRAGAFVKYPGGAVANVAVGLARLGIRSRFVSKLGADPFGLFMKEMFEREGVDVSHLLMTDEYPTGLVFVSLDENRVPSFSFMGNPSADMMLDREEVGPEALEGASFLHTGTVSMVREESRSATFKLISMAKERPVRLSFDPNLRLHLWKDHERLKGLAREVIAGSHLVKLNLEELGFATGEKDMREGAAAIKELGPDVVVVTLGPEGAYFLCDGGEGIGPAFEVKVLDTTGAGDAFAAALIAFLADLENWPPQAAVLEKAVRFANAAAAIVTTEVGAMSALPGRGQVEDMLSRV